MFLNVSGTSNDPLLNKGRTVKNKMAGATFANKLKYFIISNTELNCSQFVLFVDLKIAQGMVKRIFFILKSKTNFC